MKAHELSYWERKTLLPSSDIIVVGAGIVGLTCARVIAEENPYKSVLVLDKNPIASAASSKNAGFACFGSVSEILSDIKTLGEDEVIKLMDMRRMGLYALQKRYGNRRLQLDYCGGFELFRTLEEFDYHAEQVDFVNSLLLDNSKPFEICKTPDKFKFHNEAIFNNEEGHLDTGKLYESLVQDCEGAGVRIIRGVRVQSFQEYQSHVEIITTGLGDLKTEQLVLTTNAHTQHILPSIEVTASRNQVIVTEPIIDHSVSGTYHLDKGYTYFRDIGDRILIGGARHHFEEEGTDEFGANEENRSYLLNLLTERILPDHQSLAIEYAWSGIIASGPIKIPIVKRHSDRITLGVRLGGMGVAIGMKIGADTATLVNL